MTVWILPLPTKLIPSLEPLKSTGVKYCSSDETIAKVSNLGIVTGVKEGKVIITASVKETSKAIEITVKKTKLAKDLLKVNLSESIWKPDKISPYVNYRYAEDKPPILCRVLCNEDQYGLQLISLGRDMEVTLGYGDPYAEGNDDFEKCLNSFNNAITRLNQYAMTFKDNIGIAYDVRCMGSNPIPGHKNDESGTISKKSKKHGNVEFKNKDENFKFDLNRIVEMRIGK